MAVGGREPPAVGGLEPVAVGGLEPVAVGGLEPPAVGGLEPGTGAKGGARAGGSGSGVPLSGDAPFGLPRDRGRRLSSPLLLKEVATESTLWLFAASRCFRDASWPRKFRFESRLGLGRGRSRLGLDEGDGLPFDSIGPPREGVRAYSGFAVPSNPDCEPKP